MKRLPLVAESLDSRGLYLYDDGFRFVIWFGRMLSPDVAKNLLGADFAAELSKVQSLVNEAILVATRLLNRILLNMLFLFCWFLCISERLRPFLSVLRHDEVVLNSPGSFMFPTQVILTEHDNEMSRRLMRILKKLRESDPSYYQLPYLVRQGEQPKEGLLLLVNLLEDQMGGTSGYVDWIMQIHRQVQQNT